MNKKTRYGLIAVLALVIIAGVGYVDSRYRAARIAEAAAKFQLLGTLRRSALETYFDTAQAEVGFWSLSGRIQGSMHALASGWQQLGAEPGIAARTLFVEDSTAASELNTLIYASGSSAYKTAHAELHEFAKEFVTGRGYYDFFLIDLDGNVIYSVEKEADFGSNLVTGPYSDSGLGDVFRRVSEGDYEQEVALSDFDRYAPSDGAPAIFAGKMMVDGAGEPLGVLALQLPSDTIREIMHFTGGMGESGETYLVGVDLLMRSNSRFSETPTVLSTEVDTETVRLALAGQSGVAFTPDYRGVPVLSAYDYIDLGDFRWAVMAEIDAAEVRSYVGNIRSTLAAAGAALFALILVTVRSLGSLDALDAGNGGASSEFELDGN
jgi:methyl-accepting chemotaxis protein